jgi:hypothetical protein
MLSQINYSAKYPGLTLKAWAQVKGDGTLIKAYNVTSITKGGTGVYTPSFTVAMATTTYTVDAIAEGAGGEAGPITASAGAKSVGSFPLYVNATGAAADRSFFLAVWE